MNDLVELKPCPFCGGSASMVRGGPGNFFVQCEECRSAGDDGSKEYGIAAWNRRATDPELSRLSALVAELTKTGQIASRTPLDILGDQRIGVGVGQDGPYVTGPSSLSQLKDTTNADK